MTAGLRVEKQPVSAVVFLDDGTTLSGTIFLSPIGSNQPGRETIPELMDEPETLIPFRSQSKRFLLIGKAAVVAVRIITGESKPDLPGRVAADLKLAGGVQFNGRIVTEHDSDRLSDVLNHGDEWLRLETLNGIVWLRRDAIRVASQTVL